MQTNGSSRKSRAILNAVAEGQSFEQILARNSTVSYRDIFRTAAQAPALQAEQEPCGLELAPQGGSKILKRFIQRPTGF